VLKRLKGWSFRGLEEELRANLLYRRFTRFYEDPIPDHTVFSHLCALLGTEGPQALHAQVVTRAKVLCIATRGDEEDTTPGTYGNALAGLGGLLGCRAGLRGAVYSAIFTVSNVNDS
jgi:Transposase domain (DUF772)